MVRTRDIERYLKLDEEIKQQLLIISQTMATWEVKPIPPEKSIPVVVWQFGTNPLINLPLASYAPNVLIRYNWISPTDHNEYNQSFIIPLWYLSNSSWFDHYKTTVNTRPYQNSHEERSSIPVEARDH